ncbi:MAG TPA: GNAT family N-acetyltransferase [Crinalium sp.]|jgi:ribosomal protein S18 acetylase RimI-like enzyme
MARRSDLTIRAAVRSDIPAMQNVIRRAFLVDYGRFMPWPAVQNWVANDIGGQFVEREWDDFTVAVLGQHVVGLLQVRPGFVKELWVDPAHQRFGVGTALINHAVELAEEAGNLSLRVTVFAENLNALKFYLAQNWEPLGVPEPVELLPGAILHAQKLIKL